MSQEYLVEEIAESSSSVSSAPIRNGEDYISNEASTSKSTSSSSESTRVEELNNENSAFTASAINRMLMHPIYRDLILSQLSVRSQFRLKRTSRSMKRHMTKVTRIAEVKLGYKRRIRDLYKEEIAVREQVKKVRMSLYEGPADLDKVPLLLKDGHDLMKKGEEVESQMMAYRKEVELFNSEFLRNHPL